MPDFSQDLAILNTKKVRNANLIKKLNYNKELYIFLLLPLIYLFIFKYWPMLGAQIAFRRFNPTDGIWGVNG